MNKTESELNPGFRRSNMSSFKGDRTRHVVTMNPNKANPEEEIYIDVPKLKESSCRVPGSLHLIYNINITGTKTHFMNNLSKVLQKRLQIRIAGETVYDCGGESIYSIYKDLWKTTSQRTDSIEYGLCNQNLRKLFCKDDSGASSDNNQKVSDALMYSIFSNKQKLSVHRILRDHGLYAPFQMNNNIIYIFSLPKSSDILIAQPGETLGSYSLTNLQLEYETIDNPDIADRVTSLYRTGRSLSFEHVTLMKTTIWSASSTLINENINVPRKSMKAIVLLFTKASITDSEEYLYPNITSVKITVEGVPNMVYSQGLPQSRLYDEAKRLFSDKQERDQYITVDVFFKDKFALVIDLRSHEEVNKTAHGKKIVNTQSGVLLEITKKAHTGNINCNIFVVSDGLVNFVNNDLQSIQY